MTIELRPIKKEKFSEAEALGLVGKNFPGAFIYFEDKCVIVQCNIRERFVAREILDRMDFEGFQTIIKR